MDRRWMWAALALGVLGGCAATPTERAGGDEAEVVAATQRAEVAGTQAAEGSGRPLPGDLLGALEQLAAEDFAARDRALVLISESINSNNRDVAFLQELVRQVHVNIGRQHKVLLASRDPEVRQRAGEIMDYNAALSQFIIETLNLPEGQRAALLAYGFSGEGAVLMGKLYARDAAIRVQALSEVAEMEKELGDYFLAMLVMDVDREVAIRAMDAVWDREPCEAVVEALWRKAVEYPLGGHNVPGLRRKGYNPNESKWIKVGPRMVQYQNYDVGQQMRMADGDLACDVLIAYDSELVRRRMEGLFERMGEGVADVNSNVLQVLSGYYGGGSQQLARLMGAYRPKAAVPMLMKVVAGEARDGWSQNMGNQQFRYGSKVEALGMLVELTDQDKDDYGLRAGQQYGRRWLLEGGESEERAACKRMLKWWAANHKAYGAEEAEVKGAMVTPLRRKMGG